MSEENSSEMLPLVEEFYSIQGEGYHTGKAAYFIRLGGCDIGCHWCDTKMSWNKGLQKLKSVQDIAEDADRSNAKAIVVTGGEPLIYNLNLLCEELKSRQIKTFLETAGNHELSGEWDWICLSPKQINPPLQEIYQLADELKVIISDEDDFLWAEQCRDKVTTECKLYLQPEWSVYNTIIQDVVEYVKSNPEWNISLQSHKFMRIP